MKSVNSAALNTKDRKNEYSNEFAREIGRRKTHTAFIVIADLFANPIK